MKINVFKKLALGILCLLILLNPLLSITQIQSVKAADETDESDEITDLTTTLINIDKQSSFKFNSQQSDGSSNYKPSIESTAYKNLLVLMAKFSGNENSFLSFDDLFASGQEPKLIIKQNDLSALKSMYCLSNILTKFNEDLNALYENLPKKEKETVDKEAKANNKSSLNYLLYLQKDTESQGADKTLENSQKFDGLVLAAKKNFGDEKIRKRWSEEEENLKDGKSPSVDLNTLACVTGLGNDRIVDLVNHDKPYLSDRIKESIETLNIDVRVLKTLVYLITPKNQGGAGHWRIRVQRILQNKPQSTESDAILQTLSNKKPSLECDENMTAAECGKQQGTTPDLEIEDKDGTEYDAYLQSLTEKEDGTIKERGLSAHAEGQAVDISEIDDIRCTKVVKKNTGKTKKYKQPIQPIKLAWQTTDGWNASKGSNNFDMMSLLKSAASESVLDLLGNFNSDITDYDGDLSQANFDDIVQVLGQSLLSNILNAKSFNLEGFNVEDTLKKLGSTYVADYLGLPREIFIGENVTSLENIKYIIGRSAIEKKLNLPLGSLSGNNLPEILQMVGQRKLEHEMNLNPGDLSEYLTAKDEVFADYTGRRVLEKELNLPKSSWPKESVSFDNLSKFINPLRVTLIKSNPGLIDGDLNLGAGTTDSFVHGRMDSVNFSKLIGQKRLDDTLYGLKYFSINNNAYQLPGPTADHPEIKNTWEGALNGDLESITTIGIYTLARLLADDSIEPNTDTEYKKIRVVENGVTEDIEKGDFGRFVFRQWLRASLAKSGNECAITKSSKTVDYEITNDGQIIFTGSSKVSNILPSSPITQSVDYALITGNNAVSGSDEFVISEENSITAGFEKLDLQRVFGCAGTNSKAVFKRIGASMLYTGIANKLLSKEEKAKIDLLETNPELRVTNNSLAFYVTRANKLKDLANDIKSNWKSFSKDKPNLDATTNDINEMLDKLSNIFETGDSAFTKTQKIWQSLSDLSSQIDQLQAKIEGIKGFYEIKGEVNKKTEAINTILYDSNELVRVSSEIVSGKEIPTSDAIKVSQIKTFDLTSDNNGNSHDATTITPFKASSLIFGFLAGTVSPNELFKRFGANITESKLNLPSNTLTYLTENYEKRGLKGSESLFYAMGQAKIEEAFSMPAYYFQAKNALSQMPDFSQNASALFEYADRSKIEESISRYLTNRSAEKINSALGSSPKDLAEVKTDNDIKNILAKILVDEWYDSSELVNSARKNWQLKQEEKINSGNGAAYKFTLDDVVKNIADRGYNDAMRSAEKDLLMRLGFGGENYDALKSGGVLAWQRASSNASSIDTKMGIDSGSTKSLFTNDKGLYTASLSNNEKNLLEKNLKIAKNVLDMYIKMVNGKISTEELSQFNGATSDPDYVFANPYADDQSSTSGQCPISYTIKDGFSINESNLSNNTFCYYDKEGRHCFRSPEEAQRYATIHKDKKYGDVPEEIAVRLSESFSGNVGSDTIRKNLLNFINNRNVKYAFNSDKNKNEQILKTISTQTNTDLGTLKKLFTRDDTITILNYQLSIGRETAKKLLTYKIFGDLGLDIDPSLFGPEDFYDVLSGDMSSLYRVGTQFIDKELNLKPGTVLSVFNAKDQLSRDCSLDQIGGSIIANLVGVDYFPLRGENINDFLGNFGQSRIEQTLNLPRGTFFGQSFNDVLERSRAINIALAYKIPLTNGKGEEIIDNNALTDILGDNYAKRIKNTSQTYKAEQIQSHIRSSLLLNGSALSSLAKIDQKIKNQLNASLSQISNNKEYSGQLAEFYDQLVYLDRLFSIKPNSTYDLLSGKNGMTPDKYNMLVSTQMGTELAAAKIGESLGLDQNQSELAGNLVKNIGNIFKCQGTLVEIDGRNVCRAGSKQDDWYQNWGKLYDYLDQVFTVQLDNRANLPEGTFQKIISNPNSASATLMEIGASRIDTQFGLDSTKVFSFSGLYAKVSSSPQKDCLAEAENSTSTAPLDAALHNAETALSDIRKEKPAIAKNQKNDDYTNSTSYKQWQEKYKAALNDYEQAKKNLSKELNDKYTTCKVAAAEDPSGDIDGSFKKNIVAWAKDVLNEKIHDYAYELKAKYFGVDARIGIDIPTEDLEKMIGGDTRYFQITTLSLGVNYVVTSIDNIRTNHCNNNEEECEAAVPPEMRVNYDDIKNSFISPDSAEVYKLAAWNDVNGAYSNPEVRKVCDGSDCPKTGSGNFGSNLIDALGRKDQNSNSTQTITNRVYEQYGYSSENFDKKIDELNQTIQRNEEIAPAECKKSTGKDSGDLYENCVKDFSKNHGDPEEQLARLSDPEAYYKSNGVSFTPKNGEILSSVNKSMKKAAVENLQYKMLDMALWKLDENIYPGMARDLLKGNTEIKTAALAKYIKTGLANGQLFGIKFDAVKNIDKWAEVAIFAKNIASGDKDAFVKFTGSDGFNFFSNFLSKNSENWLGFEVDTDLAKAFLVGIGTGDWGLQSVSLDNIAKQGTGTHQIVSNGKNVDLPTVGGLLTTAITEKFFRWADKTLGLKAGQSFEVFKLGYDLYKSWQVYSEITKAKDLVGLSEGAKAFLNSKKITDLAAGKEAAKEQLAAAEVNLVYKAVSIAVEKFLGNKIANVEDDLGMLPGTLTPVVSTLIYDGIALLLKLPTLDPTTAIITAVAGYLLGQKIYYYCTADGYYPKIESPEPSLKDETGLGVWGGRIKKNSDIPELLQKKAIEASQNKARKLIQNMLWAQSKGKFNSAEGDPLIPTQIMTARQEDVDYFDQIGSITANMCMPRLGDDSISCGGICGSAKKNGCTGDTRMGIWQNPQTIAWTHIGF